MSGKTDSNGTPKPTDPADTHDAEGGTEREAPAAGVAGGPAASNLNPDELARERAADEGMEPPFSEETAAEPEAGPDTEQAQDGEHPYEEEAVEDPHRALQRAILDAALPHIAFDGWTREVLVQAAEEAGFHQGDVDLAFPGGPAEAVLTHAALADDDMALEMQTLDLDSMRTRDKIAIAIRVRLESQLANREAIRRGLRLLADPRHAPEAAKSLARTVDTIWRIAGDTSTDFNYYSKRGLLAGVYSATLVFWLQDNSEDQHRTWEFLTRRIDEVLRFGKATSGLGKVADRLPNPFRLCSGGRRRWREGPVHR
jgi:ubiquinone biosynthesis protein COQ9